MTETEQYTQDDIIPRGFHQTVGNPFVPDSRMQCRNLEVFYGDQCVLQKVDLDIAAREVLAIIGPSGCGKTSFLRCLNRMNDTIDGCTVRGTVHLDSVNIYDEKVDVVPLRARVGMVFS